MINQIRIAAGILLGASCLAPWMASAQILPNALFGVTTTPAQAPQQQTSSPSIPANSIVPDTGSATAIMPATTVAAPPTSREQYVVVNPAPPGHMFGSQLFGGTFRGALNQGFNPDYLISVGDRIQVRLWGAFNFDSILTVDTQGNIYIPNVGPISVAGIKAGQLNPAIERGVRKTFKANTDVYAALDASQPVKVFVTGFVRQPGLYGGIAADSAISFIDKAGGVDQDRGSYVDIVIKRGGQVRKRIDLYEFLLNGTLEIAQFQDGDVIVIGPRQYTFSVSGEVLNAYDFEFAEPVIPLAKALAMAKVKSGATHVSIARRQGSEKRTEYYPISEAGSLKLQDGDSLLVTSDRYQGTIQVRVEGAHSGEHAVVLPYGAKLKDVLTQIKPNSMSRTDAIQLFRKSVQARQKEMLRVSLQKVEEAALSARSMTNEEAQLRKAEADLITRFVERAKQVEPKGQVILGEKERDTTLLEDGDTIVIPERTSLVMVHGEVLFPNAVSWQEGRSAEDYIAKAGGYSQGADTSKVIIIEQNGAARLAEAPSGLFRNNRESAVRAGDEIVVLPRIEAKSVEVTRALTQILYQIAFTAKVAFGF